VWQTLAKSYSHEQAGCSKSIFKDKYILGGYFPTGIPAIPCYFLIVAAESQLGLRKFRRKLLTSFGVTDDLYSKITAEVLHLGMNRENLSKT